MVPRLIIPRARRDVVVVVIGMTIVATFFALAVWNLLREIAVISSTLWLLLVALGIVNGIREWGLRGFVAGTLGAFSRYQVLVVRDPSTLETGFRLFGLDIVEHRIAAEDLIAIRWNKGQASDMAGRDVNDWSVLLWYRDPKADGKQAVLPIGSARAKAVTEELGRRIIAFLDQTGILKEISTMNIAAMLLAQLEREVAATRKAIERVPDGKEDWKPHPKSMPLGYLTSLVATMFGWIAMMIDTEFLDLAKGERPSSTTAAERLALFDKSVENARRALSATTDEHLMKPWQLRVSGNVVDEKPRYAMIADTFSHLAHHRGQLTVYLRLNDQPVPSIYGPTADESWG